VDGLNGASGWVVPDEAMLTRLAEDFMRKLAGEDGDQPTARLTDDLTDLPISTREDDLVKAARPSRGPVRPPEFPPLPQSPPPSFYFIEEGQELTFPVEAVRRDFPILSERVNGHPLVWFDNAATTQKPQCVIDRLARFYAHENSNIHRGAHTLAARATDAFEDARSKVAAFIGAPSADDIVFTKGTTEAINLIAKTWGREHIGRGDEILVSHLEHHANIVPWQQLADLTGAKLSVIPVDDDGELRPEALGGLLTARTRLVAVAHVSNVLGTIVPVGEIAAMAHRAGARVLIDGAQAVPHTPVNVRALDPDFYVFSGHKVFGPTGIGALYAKPELLDEMPPWQGGGNMIHDVTFERTRYQPAPAKFEAGTGNIADVIGLGAALDYVSSLGMPAIEAYEQQLHAYATSQLAAVPGLRLLGNARHKASVLTFVLDGHHPADVGTALDRQGIAVRAGHHCAQPILRRYGLEAAVRPSLALYNTRAEVDQLVSALHEISAGRR
jgi:cysteine desulfurase/selenocysteine lyase